MRGLVLWWTKWTIMSAVLWAPIGASASTLDDIGFTALQSLLGGLLPSGNQSTVDQSEASVAPKEATPIYLANGTLDRFSQTQIVDQSGINSSEFSGHANSVASRIAGLDESQLSSLLRIDGYEANHWLTEVLRRLTITAPQSGTGDFGNHSWVGTTSTVVDDVDILQRLDWLVAEDDYFHAVGASAPSNSILMAYAMNVVAVKNTGATISMATLSLDGVYQAGRPAVHLVAPAGTPSDATGVVSSSAVLLTELFPSAPLVPELLKAVLMASAERVTDNVQEEQIINYGADLTQNGLDYRYGAGQLNVLNAHEILSTGTQNSSGSVTPVGYHLAQNFGAQNQVNVYAFETGDNPDYFVASLVWNLDVNAPPAVFVPNPILYNLELALFDVSEGQSTLVAESTSEIDNTENIRVQLAPHRHYELRVSHLHPTSFSWPYALAWRLTNTDLPGETKQIPFSSPSASVLLSLLLVAFGWYVRSRQC